MTSTVTMATRLAGRLTGTLVGPGDAQWDTARQAWNLAVDQRPEFVVRAATVDDVTATVRAAAEAGLRVAPQGTGHHAAALGDLTGTVLLRTDALRGITVDVAGRRVRADAGVIWDDVTAAVAPHGLMGLVGSAGDVGVAGYSLGGGCSWFSREYGLACRSVTAVEMVTGDGQFRRVDATTDPELFWAVRGGGGNAGVVTALEFAVYPMTEVYGGALLFPVDRAHEVLTAYREWVRGVPDEVGSCARLLRLPPLPEMPAALRGRTLAGIDGVFDLPADRAERLLAPLRALGPEIDTFAVLPTTAIGGVHMDPPHPAPGIGDGMIVTGLGDETIDALLAVAGPDADLPLLAVDLRHLGGAIDRADDAVTGGAVDRLAGEFMTYAVGIAPTPQAGAAIRAALGRVARALAPWAAPVDYLNFRESPTPAARFYPPDVLGRLLAVQRRYDPGRVVRAGHEWAADPAA